MDSKRYLEEDLNDFLNELIKLKRFNDSKEEGIAKLVIDEGYNKLSTKQRFVFENSMKHFEVEECSRCGGDIPWCEMSAVEDNGEQCSWCQQLGRDDNK